MRARSHHVSLEPGWQFAATGMDGHERNALFEGENRSVKALLHGAQERFLVLPVVGCDAILRSRRYKEDIHALLLGMFWCDEPRTAKRI